MAQPVASQDSFTYLDLLHNSQEQNRRLRPPDPGNMALGDDNRVALLPSMERPRRRDSKLLGLFSRQKSAATDLPIQPHAHALPLVRDRELPSRGTGLRASLAEISNWPNTLQASRSEAALPDATNSSQLYVAPGRHLSPVPPQIRSRSPSSNLPLPKSPSLQPFRSTRGALATWDPPPLFQAYPQAIRYAELPACIQSVDTILRANGRGITDQADAPVDGARDKGKRKHRRASSGAVLRADWTTKIYIVVTSGYLLQYSGEGSFDRLPEKILPLGKDSAAFASDVIPGRHWVVQVSASMESDGTAVSDARGSILSRLPFRGSERRQASHLLMVFESAEEMDQWIAILRREIEHLGGKKHLSETGKPKVEDDLAELREQTSQRTLVMRESDRFLRPHVLNDGFWGLDESADSQGSALGFVDSDMVADHQSFDEMSTTNSMASNDGRQLDSLRDGSNRFSFVSSGQRTVVTSEGTSPACSPIRTSFSSLLDESPSVAEFLVPEAKPRPNAQAILQRRMSIQNANAVAEIQMSSRAQSARSSRILYPDAAHHSAANQIGTRNFSMPHSANRRFSLISSPGSSPEPVLQLSPPQATGLSAPPRRCPPPTLGFSRPLSIVPDHPSPISPSGGPRGDKIMWGGGSKAADHPSIFHVWAQEDTDTTESAPSQLTTTAPHLNKLMRRASVQALMPSRMPRHSPNAQSFQQVQHAAQTATPPENGYSWPLSFAVPDLSARSETEHRDGPAGCALLMPAYEGSPTTQLRPSPPRASVRSRRLSMLDRSCESADVGNMRFGRMNYNAVPQRPPPPPPMTHEPPTGRLPLPPTSQPNNTRQRLARNSMSMQNIRAEPDEKTVSRRVSVQQLAEGPPPAPPPTCALPPIPSSRAVSSRGRRAQSVGV